MDYFIAFCIGGVVVWVVRPYFSEYSKTKGKHLAEKEDVAVTCPQLPYQSKFQKSGVCKLN